MTSSKTIANHLNEAKQIYINRHLNGELKPEHIFNLLAERDRFKEFLQKAEQSNHSIATSIAVRFEVLCMCINELGRKCYGN